MTLSNLCQRRCSMKIDQTKVLKQLSTGTLLTGAEAYVNKQRSISLEAQDYINDIFKRLSAICPAWKQAFSSTEEINAAKEEWITGFYDAGISSKSSVEYALGELRKSGEAFIPPVGRFIDWCHEGNLPAGTKSVDESFKEIVTYNCLPLARREPHKLSRETYNTFRNLEDIYAFRHMPEKKARDYWEAEHLHTLQTLKDGGALHQAAEPKAYIEKKEPKKAQNSVGMKAIAEMRGML